MSLLCWATSTAISPPFPKARDKVCVAFPLFHLTILYYFINKVSAICKPDPTAPGERKKAVAETIFRQRLLFKTKTDGAVKVQYLRYAQFLRISRTAKSTLHSSKLGKP
jgi:hypothetical protein